MCTVKSQPQDSKFDLLVSYQRNRTFSVNHPYRVVTYCTTKLDSKGKDMSSINKVRFNVALEYAVRRV
jgi:hypothetical protein